MSSERVQKHLDPIRRNYQYRFFGRFVGQELGTGLDILNVGTGTGRFPKLLSANQSSIVGVDISRNSLEAAATETDAEKTSYPLADGESLPFADASFVAVLSMGTFEYVVDLRPFLSEFNRILRPNGMVIFECFNAATIVPHISRKRRDGAFEREFHTIEEVKTSLTDTGFEVLRCESTGFITLPQRAFINIRWLPNPFRKLALAVSDGFNRLARRIPVLRSRGMLLIVHGRKRD